MKAERSLKSRALQLLAQRDQSRLELRRKLLRHARDREADRGAADADVDPGARRGRGRRAARLARGESLSLRRALRRVARACARAALRRSAHPQRARAACESSCRPSSQRRSPLPRSSARPPFARAVSPALPGERGRASGAVALPARARLLARGRPAPDAPPGAHRRRCAAKALRRRLSQPRSPPRRARTRATRRAGAARGRVLHFPAISRACGRTRTSLPPPQRRRLDEDPRIPGQGDPCPLRHPRAPRLPGLQRARGDRGGAKARRLGLGRQGADPCRRSRQGRRRQAGALGSRGGARSPARSSACSSSPTRPARRGRRCAASSSRKAPTSRRSTTSPC